MPVANKPSQQKQTETPYIRHKATQKKQKQKEKGEEEKQNKNMVELKTKSRAQKEAKASELHPWRLELEIFPSRLPCGHPYKKYNNKKRITKRSTHQT